MRGWRYLSVALHLVQGLLIVLLVFPFAARTTHRKLRRRWSGALLSRLGVRLCHRGPLIVPGCLLVANHVSWLDIFVINALAPTAFVSKAEVRSWPLIGWLAAHNDTVFLRRGRRGHARTINAEIGMLLASASNVAMFPEGTTSDGSRILHFHAALLQPAIEAARPVQAIALRYQTSDGRRSLAPAYAGDTTLTQSLAEIIATPGLIARVETFPALATGTGDHRREITRQARDAIVTSLLNADFPAAIREP